MSIAVYCGSSNKVDEIYLDSSTSMFICVLTHSETLKNLGSVFIFRNASTVLQTVFVVAIVVATHYLLYCMKVLRFCGGVLKTAKLKCHEQ